MDAIESRARKMLAAQYTGAYGEQVNCVLVENGGVMNSHQAAALKAVIAALTPPEGYVLVPNIPTQEMVEALADAAGSTLADAGLAYRDALAARPEVSCD